MNSPKRIAPCCRHHATSSCQATLSRHLRSKSTLPLTWYLALMQQRKQGHCWLRSSRFVSSFWTKSSSCRRFWSCGWYHTSPKPSWSQDGCCPPPPQSWCANRAWLHPQISVDGWISVVAVHEPIEDTMLPSAQIGMTQCISYAECHEKVVKSYKMEPPEVAALEMRTKGATQVCFHRNAWLAVKCCRGTINPMLLYPRHCLPSRQGCFEVAHSSSKVLFLASSTRRRFLWSSLRWCFFLDRCSGGDVSGGFPWFDGAMM
jgi:hypothetical protein